MPGCISMNTFVILEHMKIFSSFLFTTHSSTPSQSGQAGLIILLLTVAVLTVGISVASRTTTDVKLSRQEEESNRVFNEAESQIEEILSQDLSTFPAAGSQSPAPGETVATNYTIEELRILETQLFEGGSAQVDVTGATLGNNLRIRWSREQACGQNPASLLVMTFSRDSSGQVISRSRGYRICDRGDNFLTATLLSGQTYRGEVTHPLQADDQYVRIKTLYNDTSLRVEGIGWTLPIQYYKIRSVAQSTTGNESRAVEVNRTKPSAPSVFDFVLFSGSSITK